MDDLKTALANFSLAISDPTIAYSASAAVPAWTMLEEVIDTATAKTIQVPQDIMIDNAEIFTPITQYWQDNLALMMLLHPDQRAQLQSITPSSWNNLDAQYNSTNGQGLTWIWAQQRIADGL